jgi:hypothetical protein
MVRIGCLILAFAVGCGAKAAPPPAAPAPAPVARESALAQVPPPPEDVAPAEPAAAPPPDPVTQTFEAEPPKVELLDAGTGKREPLRYSSRVGEAVDCMMTMDLELRGAVTVVIPTVTMGWRGTITAADGRDLEARVVVDILEVADGSHLDAVSQRAGDETRRKLAPLLGATLDMDLDDRGVPSRTTVTTMGEIDAATAAGMKTGAGGGLVVPEKPLGIGARWRVTRVEKTALAVTTAIATYELRSRKDGVAHIVGTVNVIGKSPFSDPSTGVGTVESHFTGAHCIETRGVIGVTLPPPVSATMSTVIVTSQRSEGP